jgi:hypothetical protein
MNEAIGWLSEVRGQRSAFSYQLYQVEARVSELKADG